MGAGWRAPSDGEFLFPDRPTNLECGRKRLRGTEADRVSGNCSHVRLASADKQFVLGAGGGTTQVLVISPAIYRFGRISELLPIGFKNSPRAAGTRDRTRRVADRLPPTGPRPRDNRGGGPVACPRGSASAISANGRALGAGIARMDSSYTEALVIGAGPAGLFAACELLRHGIRPRMVERRTRAASRGSGTALQPATLEMLERGGLIEPFLARACASGTFSSWVRA